MGEQARGQQPVPQSGCHEASGAAGRERALRDKVEHIIQNKDGQIGQRNSYGHDPRSVPG